LDDVAPMFARLLNSSGTAAGETSVRNRCRLNTLRWFSVAAMCLLALPGPGLLHIDLPTLPLVAVAAATAAFNLASLSMRDAGTPWAPFPLALELGLDILAWGLFIALSGGATNPLISILLPLVAIGAAVLPVRQAWGLGLLSVFAYSLLWQFYWPLVALDAELAIHLHLAGMWLTFAVSAGVSVWFITRMTAALRDRDLALAMAREEALRNNWVVSLGSLAAGAAHELSTPLGTIGTLVEELLATPALAPGLRGDLELMQTQIEACKHSLTLLTARAGHVRAGQRHVCTAEEWLRGLAQAWRALHPAAHIGLALAPELAEVRLAPDASLEQALRCLVDNAISADPKGTRLSATRQEGHLEIRVSDQGPGIAIGILVGLDQRAPLHSANGLGIGLALSKGAIERYAGSIGFSQRPQGGTEAVVRLPLARIEIP